jgi:nucleotide-binding universal stress UspA family protein
MAKIGIEFPGLAALGSVTRQVLHLANKPVVCIKADDD